MEKKLSDKSIKIRKLEKVVFVSLCCVIYFIYFVMLFVCVSFSSGFNKSCVCE